MKAKSKPTKAAALIAAAQSKSRAPDPSPEALAELKALLDHNDASSRTYRVSAEAATKMLNGMGWAPRARRCLDDLCRRHFGRHSYGTP